MKRLNREYDLDVCNHISVRYGSIDKDNPQVVYVSGRCWVMPTEETNYSEIVRRIEKEMRKNIKLFLMDGFNFDKKFILDFDISTEGFCIGNKKFLSFEFYLKQNEDNKKQLKDLKSTLYWKVSTIVNNLVFLFNENNFVVEKNKRDF